MANAEGYVLPKPGIPKTLGILNVIFGVLLVLLGICGIGSLLVAPALVNYAEKKVEGVKAQLEAQEKADLKAIDDRLAAAKTDEEKKTIEQERADKIANQQKMPTMDMSSATDVFNNRTLMGYSYGFYISGLILHIVLLISGIGLIRLTSWGRSLGVGWAGLQIVQVLVVLAASIAVVLPINKANNDKQIAKLEEKLKTPDAGPTDASTLQMLKIMAPLALPMTVGQSVAGLIYPIVLLVLLNKAGAKAACQVKKSENIADF